ncbi:hypothetical protein GIB67_009088 [Kingdonia uniflora]|uniref:G3BP-like protein n=1 Tax=Kingdonia uniflora TaxID=39325 RepID=A0A7J7MNS1_9MAGN|nr:hypothetical protein GIB67_009088 [Kingdonia uniflora]
MALPPYSTSVSALEVGSCFVRQYYQVLQQQPDLVHHFYNEMSTMICVDGERSETASEQLQIHSLIMSLSFTVIEVKTVHSLHSWKGGVITMVSGSVQTKDYTGRRNFTQTFFLAPQEKGFFVLNDIFHFLDEERAHQHESINYGHTHYDSQLSSPNPFPEPVSDYMHSGETQANSYYTAPHVEENSSVDKYSLPEQHQQIVHEVENIVEDTPVEETYVVVSPPSFTGLVDAVQDSYPVPAEEPVGEPAKKTYASILRPAKGQPALPVVPQQSISRSPPPTSDWNYEPRSTPQQSHPAISTASGRLSTNALEGVTYLEEGEGRSVYVRNLPSNISASDIEKEFNNFGKIKLEGVVVRNREDIGVCYAFVEFEDSHGAQNALKASPIPLGGRQVHVEERRAHSTGASRGGRGRGRGRGYQPEASRGRFAGRGSVKGSGQDGGESDYSRTRTNGYAGSSQGILGNRTTRNGHNSSGSTF